MSPFHKLAPKHQRTNRFLSLRLSGFLIAACSVATVTDAAENPGAHVHGSAQLQMALENNRIDLMFTSPAYNLAGFEHEARTQDEKNQLSDIRHWLEKNPLINTEEGTCKLASATIELGGDSNSHDGHGHDHHHEDHHHHEAATHRDYEVTQELECVETASGEVFTSPLLNRFPELQELTVEWVTLSGQGSSRVTLSNPTFSPGK